MRYTNSAGLGIGKYAFSSLLSILSLFGVHYTLVEIHLLWGDGPIVKHFYEFSSLIDTNTQTIYTHTYVYVNTHA